MFKRGDKVKVVHIRPFLNRKLGDIAFIVRAEYGGKDPVIDVRWEDDKITSTYYANQFALIESVDEIPIPVEDTREYLNIITGEQS